MYLVQNETSIQYKAKQTQRPTKRGADINSVHSDEVIVIEAGAKPQETNTVEVIEDTCLVHEASP
jgi:hypothetical protein